MHMISDFLNANKDNLDRIRLNTFVVEKQKILYMDTPKTGGTSIKSALVEMEDKGFVLPDQGGNSESTKDMFIHVRKINPLPSVFDFEEDEQEKILFSDEWNRFCVVRNPYDRLFSAWFSKLVLNESGYREKASGLIFRASYSSVGELYEDFFSFVEYLHEAKCFSDAHWARQVDLLFQDQISWGGVIKFENLAGGLDQFFMGIDCAGLSLRELNVSGFRPDYNKFPKNIIDKIYLLYKDDFDRYGYDKSPVCKGVTANEELLCVYINAVSLRNNRISGLLTENKIKQQELKKVVDENEWRRARIAAIEGSRSWKTIRFFLDIKHKLANL